jgi:maltose O-acetyltransferase
MKYRFNSLTAEHITHRKTVHEICRQFSRSPSKGNLKRLKNLFGQCGEHVIIESGFHLDYGSQVFIGDRTYININCTFLDGINTLVGDTQSNLDKGNASIFIGSDCLIGPNVQLLSVSHDLDPHLRQTHKYNYVEAITLADNVWLGAGVIVLAGVTIGKNSVIGAGSVVTKNVAENSFYAGNPAIKIKSL